MKRYFIILLLVVFALAAGCSIKQDYSLCSKENNCVLYFTIQEIGGDDLFREKVDHVDVVLFDADKKFVMRQIVDKEELLSYTGVKLTVDPGDYYVVCWANVSSKSRFSLFDKTADLEKSYVEVVSDESSSELYYAPRETPKTKSNNGIFTRNQDDEIYKVRVRPNQVTTKDLYFVRAYRSAHVYIQNFSNHSDYDGKDPLVEITNIPYKYDFLLNTDPGRKNYQKASSLLQVKSEAEMSYAKICAPIGDFQDDMELKINRSSDGLTVYSLNIKNYVDENIDKIDNINRLNILISFGINADVTVSVPDWDEIPVNPI